MGQGMRTTIRLVAVIISLVLLGLAGLQCGLNYAGELWDSEDATAMEWIKTGWHTMTFGLQRTSLLLWDSMNGYDNIDYKSNWGDLLVLALILLLMFGGTYAFVALVVDWLDGSKNDLIHSLVKFVITLGVVFIISGVTYVITDKPDGNWQLNNGLLLDSKSKQTCIETGKYPMFIVADGENVTIRDTFSNETTPLLNSSSVNNSNTVIDLNDGGGS